MLANLRADTFASWLRRHPEVKMICRDRAGSFRDGACAGAPQAKQVADMWHVLHNLAEAVERIVGRHRAALCEPLATAADAAPAGGTLPAEVDIHGRPRLLVSRTRERYQQIHERIQRGDSLRAIDRERDCGHGPRSQGSDARRCAPAAGGRRHPG
ncbi:transposase [Streptomyces sp. BA2]|uniref:transposase n=1 Tax=Streptomyces sp. BA2 TaxID=436595 RepID=UPI001323F7D2|nr:hypothetical protein [Streptomyces sp. BA2]